MKKNVNKKLLQKTISLLLGASLVTSNFNFLSVDVYAETQNIELENIETQDVDFGSFENTENTEFDDNIGCIIDDVSEITDFDNPNVDVTNSTSVGKTTKTTPVKLDMSNYVVNEPVNNQTLVMKNYGVRTYLENVTTYRGDMAIREYIPFELKAGESITLKQTGGLNQQDIIVQLKTGLSTQDTQSTIKKNGTEVTMTAVDDSICYMRVPRTNFKDITIEYSITNATTLPVFKLDETDEATFFTEWDTLNTEFALLENETLIMQVPKMNKEYLRALKSKGSFNDINHLLTYYKEMIEFYDAAYGLDGSTEYNVNPKQKYLVVPEYRDTGGIVGTYEPEIVRAFGTSRGVLKMLDDSWLAKHEIGHGYQGDMMDWDVSVREIWNNIPSHYYSMVTNSNTQWYRNDYNNTKKPANQKGVYEKSVRIRQQGAGPSYNLEFFREIFDQYGLEVFTKFNQEYRRLGLTGAHDDMSNSNRFAEYFSKYAGVDLAPYFLSYNFNIDDTVIKANAELPNAYYLTELVTSKSVKDYVINEYDLVTEYSLIDTSVFIEDENLNVSGDVTVNIDIDDTSELDGKQILLKNGEHEFYSEIVDGKAVYNDLPVGVYNLFVPLTNSGMYTNDAETYVHVSENGNITTDVKYIKLEDFYLNLNYKVDLRSDANYTPFTATLSYVSDDYYKLSIKTLADRYNPNASTNSLYTYFKVYDEKGTLVEDYEFYNLTPSVASTKTTYVKPGYRIEIYRGGNKSRKVIQNTMTYQDFNDSKKDLMKYEVTEEGLIYSGGSYGKAVTDSFIKLGSTKYFNVENQYLNDQERVYLSNAISYLNDSDKETYLKTYAKYLRTNNPVIETEENIEAVVGKEVEYNATATDLEDGNLDSKVFVKETDVDYTKVGEYTTTLRVEDSDHNYDEVVVNVSVKPADRGDITTVTPDMPADRGNATTVTPEIPVVEPENPEIEEPVIENPEIEEPVIENPNTEDETDNNSSSEVEVDNEDDINSVDNSGNSNLDNNNNSNNNSNSNSNTSNPVITDDNYYDFNDEDDDSTTDDDSSIHFIDIDNSWAKSSIEYVAERDILRGVTENTFEPKTEVTRAMTATVLGRMSDAETEGLENDFEDVREDVWYTDYVSWATEYDIVEPVDNNSFEPNESITREELAVSIENYLEYSGYPVPDATPVTFFDDSSIAPEAKSSVYNLRALGILRGDTEGNFNPKSSLTREELSAILERVDHYTNDIDTMRNNK